MGKEDKLALSEDDFVEWRYRDDTNNSRHTYRLYQGALERWGSFFQMLIMAEESTELATACLHHIRGGSLDDVAEEVADVMIMVEQIFAQNGSEFWTDVMEWRKIKLERLQKRLEEDLDIGRDNRTEGTTADDASVESRGTAAEESGDRATDVGERVGGVE